MKDGLWPGLAFWPLPTVVAAYAAAKKRNRATCNAQAQDGLYAKMEDGSGDGNTAW